MDTLDGNISCGVDISVAAINPDSALLKPAVTGPWYRSLGCPARRNSTGHEIVDCNATIGGIEVIRANMALGTVFVVQYTVSDHAGNTAVRMRNITIVDTLPPILTFQTPGPLYVGYLGTVLSRQNVTCWDEHDGDLTGRFGVGGDFVNTVVPASYILRYSGGDAQGNELVPVNRSVIVLPQTPPVGSNNTAHFAAGFRMYGITPAVFNVPQMHRIFNSSFVAVLRNALLQVFFLPE